MKYKSLLKGICPIAIGISLSFPTVAQYNTIDIGGLNSRFEKSIKERFSMKNGHFPLVLSAPSGAAKTTATRARLVSAHMMEYDGGSWVGGSDSMRFFWSGLRGGDFDYAGFMVMAT
jgi:hypothetical protein